ncbi:MAG: hypothetical protein AB8C84_07355 [Oligoflexales bacterium]
MYSSIKTISFIILISTTPLYSGTSDIYDSTQQTLLELELLEQEKYEKIQAQREAKEKHKIFQAQKAKEEYEKIQAQEKAQKEYKKIQVQNAKYEKIQAKRHKKIYPLLACAIEMIEDAYSDGHSIHAGLSFLEYIQEQQFHDLKTIEKRCIKILKKYKKNFKKSKCFKNFKPKSDFEKHFEQRFPYTNINTSDCSSEATSGLSLTCGLGISFGGGLYQTRTLSYLGLSRKVYKRRLHAGLGFGLGLLHHKAPYPTYDTSGSMFGCIAIIGDEEGCCDVRACCGVGIFTLLDLSEHEALPHVSSYKHHRFTKLLTFLGFEQ